VIRKLARLFELLKFAPSALAQVVISQVREHTSHRIPANQIGKGSHILRTLSLRNAQNIVLGKNVILGPHNLFWCSANARLTIGDHALFAPYVSIFTANHGFADLQTPINDQPEVEADVTIGRGAWLGCRAVILSGVTVGEGAIVAAGAVVNRDVAPYDIVGGVPARRIGSRLPKRDVPERAIG
jgi:acetyltransferase-like isoleucine patch superfamily enzyme